METSRALRLAVISSTALVCCCCLFFIYIPNGEKYNKTTYLRLMENRGSDTAEQLANSVALALPFDMVRKHSKQGGSAYAVILSIAYSDIMSTSQDVRNAIMNEKTNRDYWMYVLLENKASFLTELAQEHDISRVAFNIKENGFIPGAAYNRGLHVDQVDHDRNDQIEKELVISKNIDSRFRRVEKLMLMHSNIENSLTLFEDSFYDDEEKLISSEIHFAIAADRRVYAIVSGLKADDLSTITKAYNYVNMRIAASLQGRTLK